MDPETALQVLRALANDAIFNADHPPEKRAEKKEHAKRQAERAEKMAEAFQALDGWLCKGGFLPSSWFIAQKDKPSADGARPV